MRYQCDTRVTRIPLLSALMHKRAAGPLTERSSDPNEIEKLFSIWVCTGVYGADVTVTKTNWKCFVVYAVVAAVVVFVTHEYF